MIDFKKAKRIAELESQLNIIWHQIRKLEHLPPAIIIVGSTGIARPAYDLQQTLHTLRLGAPAWTTTKATTTASARSKARSAKTASRT